MGGHHQSRRRNSFPSRGQRHQPTASGTAIKVERADLAPKLLKMMEVRGKAALEDNSYMFKKQANLQLPTYDEALNPKAFRDWI